PVAISTPVAGERVDGLQRWPAPPYAVDVEQPPLGTRRWRQHPRCDLGLGIVSRGTAGNGDCRSEHCSSQNGGQAQPHRTLHSSRPPQRQRLLISSNVLPLVSGTFVMMKRRATTPKAA